MGPDSNFENLLEKEAAQKTAKRKEDTKNIVYGILEYIGLILALFAFYKLATLKH